MARPSALRRCNPTIISCNSFSALACVRIQTQKYVWFKRTSTVNATTRVTCTVNEIGWITQNRSTIDSPYFKVFHFILSYYIGTHWRTKEQHFVQSCTWLWAKKHSKSISENGNECAIIPNLQKIKWSLCAQQKKCQLTIHSHHTWIELTSIHLHSETWKWTSNNAKLILNRMATYFSAGHLITVGTNLGGVVVWAEREQHVWAFKLWKTTKQWKFSEIIEMQRKYQHG